MSEQLFLRRLESYYRSLNYMVGIKERTLLVKGERPFVIELSPDFNLLRVMVLTDIEPNYEEYRKILELNFFKQGIKIALDPEGFLAIINEIPYECVKGESPSLIHERYVAYTLRIAEDLERKKKRESF